MSKRTRSLAAIAALATAATAGAVAVVTAAEAAAGCRVDYTVTSQRRGSFSAGVTVTNLGDGLGGWSLAWTYPGTQTVTAVTGASASVPAGPQVTVTGTGGLSTNASASFTVSGTYRSSNPAPTSFTLNGTVCTGGVGTPTTAPTTGAPSTGQPPASYPAPGRVTGDTGTHDPTVVKKPDGSYLLAATGIGLSLKTSTDRTAWRNAGAVWPNGASWTTTYTNGDRNLWAPDISYHNGQYYLYYSASSFGSQRSAIFLATSPTGASGSWTHRGLVIESSTAVNYNAIDPNLYVESDGSWWLSFGSFWSGIKLIRLDPASGLRSTSDTAVRALSTRPTAGGAVEAPFIIKRGQYYYLLISFDRCCQGASSTYRIMVGRSTSLAGPYTDRNGVALTNGGGTEILSGRGSIHGPGHQAVFNDNGTDVLVYHYYADSGASYLGINLLGYDSAGWPYVY